jgi:uncharacterized protein (DUF1499 family)
MLFIFLLAGLPAGPTLTADAAAPSLKPCPSSPNCISSLAEVPGQRIDPFPLAGTPEETLNLLARAVEAFTRASVVLREGPYLRAEFRSWLGFVDDVEFLVDEARGAIQVRSGSRTGYWDLGVNRERMEALRRTYLEMKDRK